MESWVRVKNVGCNGARSEVLKYCQKWCPRNWLACLSKDLFLWKRRSILLFCDKIIISQFLVCRMSCL
ncbi:unnamed protein product [Tenebrio molitor]|nr:unnamed protein product [Tenebrio molitor]